jgi:uncharacterized protein DUF6184
MRTTPTLMISIVAAALLGACIREDTTPPRATPAQVDTSEFDHTTAFTASPSTNDPMKQAPTELHAARTTNLTGDEGVTQLVIARCAREERCGHVGAGQKFPSTALCQLKLSKVQTKAFGAESCPSGVSEVPLRECMENIGDFACDQSLDTVDSVDGCATAVLCVDS